MSDVSLLRVQISLHDDSLQLMQCNKACGERSPARQVTCKQTEMLVLFADRTKLKKSADRR